MHLPRRTDNDVKNRWHSAVRTRKRVLKDTTNIRAEQITLTPEDLRRGMKLKSPKERNCAKDVCQKSGEGLSYNSPPQQNYTPVNGQKNNNDFTSSSVKYIHDTKIKTEKKQSLPSTYIDRSIHQCNGSFIECGNNNLNKHNSSKITTIPSNKSIVGTTLPLVQIAHFYNSDLKLNEYDDSCILANEKTLMEADIMQFTPTISVNGEDLDTGVVLGKWFKECETTPTNIGCNKANAS